MQVSAPDPFKLLEFENPHDVEGRLSIADLLPKSRSRCGIYMFALANGLFYIGQSRDAAKRYAQHRKKYDNITRFAFRHVERQDLDEIEQTFEEGSHNAVFTLSLFSTGRSGGGEWTPFGERTDIVVCHEETGGGVVG